MSEKKIDFLNIGAICIMASIVVLIISMIVDLFARVGGATDMETVLLSLYDYRAIKITVVFLGLIAFLLMIPGIFSFKQFLRLKNVEDKKNLLLWLPFTQMFAGVLAMISRLIISLVLYLDIIPSFVGATDPEKTELLELASSLITTINTIYIIDTILIFTLGAGVFALFGFQKSEIPSWAGWVGVIGGVLSLGVLGSLASGVTAEVFSWIVFIGTFCSLTWITYMGRLIFQIQRYKRLKGLTY